jgi:hypothetical protein
MDRTTRRPRVTGTLATALLAALMVMAAVPQTASAETVLIESFWSGEKNITMDFHSRGDNTTYFEIPRGAAVINATLSVRGIEGANAAFDTMDFSTDSVGDGLWALHEEATGIYEPTVDPYNATGWDAMPSSEVANVKAVDGKYWHTKTPTNPTVEPWEYPMQMFHFVPGDDGAISYEITWRGHGYCAGNSTWEKGHIDLYVLDDANGQWWRKAGYGTVDDRDEWCNCTLWRHSTEVRTNGSVDFLIVGSHAEVDNTGHNPVTDYGHIYTDYVGVIAEYPGDDKEFPQNVTVKLGLDTIWSSGGPLNTSVKVGEDLGFASILQAYIDTFPVEPGNIMVDLEWTVERLTFARVEVSDLNITYDPSGVIPNDAPVWIGPSSLEVQEDSGWTSVIDLGKAFTDDYGVENLEFNISSVSDPGYLDTRLEQDAGHSWWLQVRPFDDFYGHVIVNLKATDRYHFETESPDIDVSVVGVPDAPILIDFGELEAYTHLPFVVGFLALDADFPDETLSWYDTSGLFDVDVASGTVNWTPTDADIGRHSFLLTVTDSFGLSDSLPMWLSVSEGDHAPTITSPLRIHAVQDQPVVYQLTADDPALPIGDVLTLSASSEDIAIAFDASTGNLTFTPGNEDVGQLSISLRAEDLVGSRADATLVVDVENVNDAPWLVEAGDLAYKERDTVSFHLSFGDPDALLDLPVPETLTLTSDGPSWLAPDQRGWVNFTIDQARVGEHVVRYIVTDRAGLTDRITVRWLLRDANDPPVIVTAVPSRIVAREGEPFALDLDATDVDSDTLTWSDDSPMFAIDPTTGAISFTPDRSQVGTHRVTVSVDDGVGDPSTVSFDLVVEHVNVAPSITTDVPARYTVKEHARLTIELAATDVDGDALAWSDDSTVFDIDPATGRISFVPDQPQVGSHVVTVTVSDGHNGSASVSFELVVQNVNDAPVIRTLLPANGTSFKEGEAVTFTVTADDEDGDALSFMWREGSTPLGTGSPLAIGSLGPGRHTITLSVTDGKATVERTVEVVVQSKEGGGGGGKGGPMPLALGLLLVGIAVIVVVALALRARRGAPPAEQGAAEAPGAEEAPRIEVEQREV